MIENKLKGKLLKLEYGVTLPTYVWVADFAQENSTSMAEIGRTAISLLRKRIELGEDYKSIKKELNDD